MKHIVILGMIVALAGCGGANRFKDRPQRGVSAATPFYAPSASGPLRSACLASDRKARSDRLCGCIQAVADQHLSRGDQARAVKFYRDPQSAQDIRQSSRESDKRFWKSYSEYGTQAARICT
ncbi:hypothetical protein DC366_02490 [Pelagivirga sediminicola]|uniref:Arginine transporter n=1 Tax=Pelagivirga sediminicola TaxID=2170575 RepID=A0A2T7GCF6_9RHOB|nr:hypothetical protein [Pelagivirga sediminicola]PVA12084.1 hypothetical protein DC366_02490 [Pelagivirga sediminicola]